MNELEARGFNAEGSHECPQRGDFRESRKALLTADAAQKGIIDTRNRAIRVNQGLLRTEQQRNSAVLAGLRQERRASY